MTIHGMMIRLTLTYAVALKISEGLDLLLRSLPATINEFCRSKGWFEIPGMPRLTWAITSRPLAAHEAFAFKEFSDTDVWVSHSLPKSCHVEHIDHADICRPCRHGKRSAHETGAGNSLSLGVCRCWSSFGFSFCWPTRCKGNWTRLRCGKTLNHHDMKHLHVTVATVATGNSCQVRDGIFEAFLNLEQVRWV